MKLDVRRVLEELTGREIPDLNCQVRSSDTKLPSDGFIKVNRTYRNLTDEEKRQLVEEYINKVRTYDYDWVLEALGLNEEG